jgi:hypothetical protein
MLLMFDEFPQYKHIINSTKLVNGFKTKYVAWKQNDFGSGGIWTHASEETGALNQRLRPLGHATFLYTENF